MKGEFTPILLEDYVDLHLRANPGEARADLMRRLALAIEAAERGDRCRCGSPIWIVGSAQMGLSCFRCITGEAAPNDDYEIDVSIRKSG